MRQENFLSLRLGFSHQQADAISKFGIEKFLDKSFKTAEKVAAPACLDDAPKTLKELHELKQLSADQKKVVQMEERKRAINTQHWWIMRMYQEQYPLREKMVLFWHNHFVSSFQKVKSSWLMYEQNQLFREHAFGNFKELTKAILYNNAMLLYLDNNQNKAASPNENLSRELLELFTLGIGHYSETDIKEGARILAGLGPGPEGGFYRPKQQDEGIKNYLGKSGNLKVEEMVDAIFSQAAIPYRLTEKLLKYFATDMPSPDLIKEYGDYFATQNFEIKPFLLKLFQDKRLMQFNGWKIKDPLLILLQSAAFFHVQDLPVFGTYRYLRNQNMELLNPPNVKGWDGGQSWLNAALLIQREGLADLFCYGNGIKAWGRTAKMMNDDDENDDAKVAEQIAKAYVQYDKGAKNNKAVIQELSDQLLFTVDADMQNNMESILKYDFNPASDGAIEGVKRLMNYMLKTPEYQIY